MTKPSLLIAALAGCLLFTKANAQVDTSHFDLGRIQLKKDFTQNVTVKGEDLEKMPFDNLADAINAWFYGAHTNRATLVYIIDGNLANDVNAYSVYDIDEVTLIQSALTPLNGAIQNQQLVLIKTKRPKGKGYGVIANGQANFSTLHTNLYNNLNSTSQTGQKSTTVLYQQYYVSAYKNTDNIQFGVSADYLRDVMPIIKQVGTDYKTPDNFNRLRLNGYFDAKIGSSSTLDITAGYVPQKARAVYELSSAGNEIDEDFSGNERIWNGSVKLITHIAPGFTNTLHGDYNNYQDDERTAFLSTSQSGSTLNTIRYNHYNHNIVAYDNLSFDAKFSNWGIEPAVNLSFRTFSDSTGAVSAYLNQNGNIIGVSNYSTWINGHTFLLTPSVNLYYKTYFNIQIGALYNIATIGSFTINKAPQKVFPFASASVDVMHLIDPDASASVKAYGSYSLSGVFADNYSALNDFTNTSIQIPILGSPNNAATSAYDLTGIYNFTRNAYETQNSGKTFKTFSAGLSISPAKSGLEFGYFFERLNYLSPVYMYAAVSPNGTTVIAMFDNTNAFLHSLRLNYNLVNGTAFNWKTGINATLLKQNYDVNSGPMASTGGNEWTGGWANRLSYNSFFAGVYVLYQLGEKIYTTMAPNYNALILTKINSFSLQNLYAGYRFKVTGLKSFEAFANGRNIFQNKRADITDGRRYYGLGFRASL